MVFGDLRHIFLASGPGGKSLSELTSLVLLEFYDKYNPQTIIDLENSRFFLSCKYEHNTHINSNLYQARIKYTTTIAPCINTLAESVNRVVSGILAEIQC